MALKPAQSPLTLIIFIFLIFLDFISGSVCIFKLRAFESSTEVGVNLKQGYNGDLTSKQAGSIGGQMVKKMIESYENSMK